MNGGPRLVVADANVYVDAVVHDSTKVLGDPPALSRIPSLPPRTVHPALHLLGVVRDGSDTGDGPGLAISDHILLMTIHASAATTCRTRPYAPTPTRSGRWPSGPLAGTTATCPAPSTTAPTRKTT